jgi:hypothetical protein
VLFENDDAPGWDRSFVAFVVEPGVTYHVLASSWGGGGRGPYASTCASASLRPLRGDRTPEPEPTVESDLEPAAPEVEAPSFAELLSGDRSAARALRLLADRSGPVVSTTTVEGSTVVTRTHWPMR